MIYVHKKNMLNFICHYLHSYSVLRRHGFNCASLLFKQYTCSFKCLMKLLGNKSGSHVYIGENDVNMETLRLPKPLNSSLLEQQTRHILQETVQYHTISHKCSYIFLKIQARSYLYAKYAAAYTLSQQGTFYDVTLSNKIFTQYTGRSTASLKPPN